MSSHAWASREIIESLSREEYGVDLARRVAGYLRNNRSISNEHRDYCGVGLFFHNTGNFTVSYVMDGFCDTTIRDFQNEDAFVEWLSVQSDYTMSGVNDNLDDFYLNNQRITREKLEGYIGD